MKKLPVSKNIYWDACVFLDLIEGDEERRHGIEAVLDEAGKGRFLIHTSVLTIAEVMYAKSEKDNAILDRDIECKIRALWQPGSPFTLVDVFRGIVEDAQELSRESMANKASVKPADAIHLAAAHCRHDGSDSVHREALRAHDPHRPPPQQPLVGTRPP